ncbi:MAG: 4-oxalocrotonate tautomerase family protein [Moraxellaceae bacterium]|nr:MAG: 4-oxalocrotonate tautomerase family protein [Moraxellaceae bacterium]
MPFVTIKVANESITKEQKAALISGVTDLLEQVLNKHPATTYVVIEEIHPDNWGVKGVQVSERENHK